MMNLMKIADSLPTREDVLNAIGAAAGRSNSTDISMMLGVFGAGILIGAGLALLFAPKPGSELRQDIENRVAELRQGFVPSEGRSASAATPGPFGTVHGAV